MVGHVGTHLYQSQLSSRGESWQIHFCGFSGCGTKGFSNAQTIFQLQLVLVCVWIGVHGAMFTFSSSFFLSFLKFFFMCAFHVGVSVSGSCAPPLWQSKFSLEWHCSVGPVYCSRDPQTSLFSNFFIKNGFHGTIHTFKNYFVTVFSIFNFQQNKRYLNTLLIFFWRCLTII